MVYKRSNRPGQYFQAKTRTGWEQKGCETTDKALAQKIEAMWNELAEEHRAWDVLERVRPLRKKAEAGTVTIGTLYDWWIQSGKNVIALRRKLNDVDLTPLVEPWQAWLKTQSGGDWAAHSLTQVRRIVPEGKKLLASDVTPEWLTTEMVKIPFKRNTIRKYASAWSSFFGYCTAIAKAFAANPMDAVLRGERELQPPEFYDGVTAERIVDWQPTDARRAYFALMYGTPADVSPALKVERSDINPATKEVRIAGTKSRKRDRIVRVADWAWPIFWSYAKNVISGRIFPEWSRWTVSDWHRWTVGSGTKNKHGGVEREGLNLSKRLPLRKARHHYAVRMLSAGVPARVVADMMGSDEKTVLTYYGPWVPTGADRAKWEKVATLHETKRRKAK